MRPADNVKKFFEKAAIGTNPRMDDAVLGKVLTAQEQAIKTESAEYTPDMWRIIMKSRIIRLAAVVTIIASILAAMNYLGLPVTATAPVLADMIEEISKAHSVSYKHTIYSEDEAISTSEQVVNESGVRRYLFASGYVTIYDRKSGKSLSLNPQTKKGQIIYKVGRDKGIGLVNYLDWLSSLHAKSGRFMGREEVDGRAADVFVVERDFRAITIWVDPETDLPIQVEQIYVPPVGKGIIVPKMSLDEGDFGGAAENRKTITVTGDGVHGKRRIVWRDFIWNPEPDESLFSLEPPEDYSVEETVFDVSDRGENGLIDALAFWTQMSGGLFPSNINDLGDPDKVRPMLIDKFDRDGDPKEELDQAVKQMNVVLKGLWFAQKCKVQGNWYYCGDGVRLGDSDSCVCWWKSEDSDGFRVIYGDLSLADCDDAPQARHADQ